jgi:hypothetical protein
LKMLNVLMDRKRRMCLHRPLDKVVAVVLLLLHPRAQLRRMSPRKLMKGPVAELRRRQSQWPSPSHKSNLSRRRTFWGTVTTTTSLRVFRSVGLSRLRPFRSGTKFFGQTGAAMCRHVLLRLRLTRVRRKASSWAS